MRLRIEYNMNPHQKEFQDDVVTKFLHLSCGIGGGKSHGLVMKAFQLSALNKDLPGGLVCPSFADYKRDILPLIENICDENHIRYHHHKTENYFIFPWSKGKMYIATAEKKIRGPNWSYACINESTLISKIRYLEVVGRVRIKSAKHPQIASSGTPEGTDHWKYEVFIEEPMKNSRVIYGDTRDNMDNLEEGYIEGLEASYDKIMLDAYLRGLWVNMAGNRFYYAYDPIKNDNMSICRNDFAISHISLDFNVDPMTCNMWHYDGKHLNGYDSIELTGDVQGHDTYQLCDALTARGYDGDNCIIYPDPAGRARSTVGKPNIEIIKQKGFYQVKYKTKAPNFTRRRLLMNNVLDKRIIQIHPKNCKGLKKDFTSVIRDPVTLGKIKTNPKLTHHSDGVDYMVDLMFPFYHNRAKSEVHKFR